MQSPFVHLEVLDHAFGYFVEIKFPVVRCEMSVVFGLVLLLSLGYFEREILLDYGVDMVVQSRSLVVCSS